MYKIVYLFLVNIQVFYIIYVLPIPFILKSFYSEIIFSH